MTKFKRILLVLTIGVSFAPPVFAVEGRQERVANKQLGEVEEPNLLGAKCEASRLVEKVESQIAAVAAESTAGGAR